MPIEGFIGLPGAGKTYAAVRRLARLRRLDPNRSIYSNTPLYLPGEPVRLVETIEEAYQLEHCHLLLDELHAWLPAAEWQQLGRDKRFLAWATQLRKRDVDLWFTTQDTGLIVKALRELVAFRWELEAYRKLFGGLFLIRGYFGARASAQKQFYRGFFLLNPRLAALYDTDYRVTF